MILRTQPAHSTNWGQLVISPLARAEQSAAWRISICAALALPSLFTNQTLSGTVVLGPSSIPGTQLIPSHGPAKITYDVYAIDATHLKFIEMDTGGTLSGDAFSQTSTSMPSNTTLASTLLGNIATGGFMVTDGNGNIGTSTEDVNNSGNVSPAPINFTGTTTAGGTGRSNAGLLLMEIDGAGIMVGTALPQSSTASLATSQGYALNLSGTNLSTGFYLEVDDIAEFSTSNNGTNLTGVTDKDYAPQGTQNYASNLSGSYTPPDSSGRGQLAANASNTNNGTLNGGFGLTYYTVDGSTFPFIESDNGQAQVTVGVFLKQNSSSSGSGATRPHLFLIPPLVRPQISRQQK